MADGIIMSVMPNDGARPIHLVIQQIGHDRRGCPKFVVLAAGGRVLCNGSLHPIACAAANLLDAGYDPATPVVFEDAVLSGFQQHMTLSKAIALDDVVVPMRGRDGGRHG